jgi:hypothetical protein
VELLGRREAAERHREAVVVVRVFPGEQRRFGVIERGEVVMLPEVFVVDSVTSFDFPVGQRQ